MFPMLPLNSIMKRSRSCKPVENIIELWSLACISMLLDWVEDCVENGLLSNKLWIDSCAVEEFFGVRQAISCIFKI